MAENGAFRLTVTADNIAIVTIDALNESVNTLKAAFAADVRAVLQRIREQPAIRGVIFISAKADNFIVGADIFMISACRTAEEAEALSREGQQIMREIADLNMPVVAAIHGSCLGGGLELALACHARICTDAPATRLGLPEVQLGLLPGAGGTQRLPRLVGMPVALDLMLTGRQLSARQALKTGLVDEVVAEAQLLPAALSLISRGLRPAPGLPVKARLLGSRPLRPVFIRLLRNKTAQKTQGNYPAVVKIIEVVSLGLAQGIQKGEAAEARAFGILTMTPASVALRRLFFATTELKRAQSGAIPPRSLRSVGIVGGGLMGSGIAWVTVHKAQLPVRLKDIHSEGISQVLRYSWQRLSQKVARGQVTLAQRDREMARLSGGTDYQGFRHQDVVIEAVFEDLALKQQIVAEVGQFAAPDTLFASNTSSIPIWQIAASARHPEQVIGLHYFSPVEKMALVEVIPHRGTSPQTISTVVALARRQGKMPLVVADKAGFYVNRILAPCIIEALHCLTEGEPVEHIDRALVAFGFPLGSIQLLDEVGIDVGAHIMPVLEQAFGERFTPPASLQAILSDNRKGRKNGRGFYRYSGPGKQRKKEADDAVYSLLKVRPKARSAAEHLAERCVMMLLNEAVRTLDEKVISGVRDGEIGAVFGIGFPPFLGGPFHYMNQQGVATIVSRMRSLASQYGPRFLPCERLIVMAEQGDLFDEAGW